MKHIYIRTKYRAQAKGYTVYTECAKNRLGSVCKVKGYYQWQFQVNLPSGNVDRLEL